MAIGNFDGVHLGHRRVLDGCDTVITFDPHPKTVLSPRSAPRLLTDRRCKLRKLAELGIRRVVVIPFDRSWSQVTAEDFIEDVVLDGAGARSVSVGEGFRFGADGAGDPTTFERYSELDVTVVPLLAHGPSGAAISSTLIRQLVLDGRTDAAADLLGDLLKLPAAPTDGRGLSIRPEFAIPPPGRYFGRIDRRATILRVRDDLTIDVDCAIRTTAPVTVTFGRRCA